MATDSNIPWQDLAAAHQQKQLDAIPKEWVLDAATIEKLEGTGTESAGRLIENDAASCSGLLTVKELSITGDMNASELVGKLSSGSLTSEEVVTAFSKRAALAQQLTSCLTEIFFDEALTRAKWLDEQLKKTGKPVGPLHGLPISLKDSYAIKGHYATAGYIEFLRRPVCDKNAATVDILLEAGAVLYCKTNVPQTMMTADSENNIFGRTVNPHNAKLTAGGSTGGEGALIAFHGSPLGVGSDIAGSIRIPSLCCGIYGFKPTSNRVPFAGQTNTPLNIPVVPGISPVSGPMANSVADLALFMETILHKRPWKYDSNAMDIPWRTLSAPKEGLLRIGVPPEDAEYKLHPPVRRALAEAASILEKAGHTIVRLPEDSSRSICLGGKIGFQYFFLVEPDLGALAEALGEPLVASVARGVHPFTDGIFPIKQGQGPALMLSDWTKVAAKYAATWRDVWIDQNLDVLIAPGAATTAVPHDTYGNPMYTTVWNALDYPAGIIPFGKASKVKDPNVQKATVAFDPDYDPEIGDGAPCAIQVIAPRFHDEECLQAMAIIDKALKEHGAES